MKLKSKSSKKKIIIIVLCLVALAVAAGGYALYKNQNTQQDQDASEFKDAQPASKEDEKKQQSYEEQKKEQTAEEHEHHQASDSLTVTFTSVGQMDSIVRVRAEINTLMSDGTCTLTLVKGSSSVTKTAATYPTAHVSTCQGFDIPTTELSPGTWEVTLEVTKDSQAGRATTTVDVS